MTFEKLSKLTPTFKIISHLDHCNSLLPGQPVIFASLQSILQVAARVNLVKVKSNSLLFYSKQTICSE